MSSEKGAKNTRNSFGTAHAQFFVMRTALGVEKMNVVSSPHCSHLLQIPQNNKL